jgi:hypothetical protein
MLNENEKRKIKALIEEEIKILDFYVRYEDEIKEIATKREWEIEVDECLDNLIIYYQLLMV